MGNSKSIYLRDNVIKKRFFLKTLLFTVLIALQFPKELYSIKTVEGTELAKDIYGRIILEKDSVIKTPHGNLKFKGKTQLNLNDEGNLRSGTLAYSQKIKSKYGIITIKGHVEFNKIGIIETCILVSPYILPTPIGKLTFTGGISFDNLGNVISGGIAPAYIPYSESQSFVCNYISFHENGTVKHMGMDEYQVIKCNLGNIKIIGLELFPNGKISFLNTRQYITNTIKNQTYIFNCWGRGIYLHDNGMISVGYLEIGSPLNTKWGTIQLGDIYSKVDTENDNIGQIAFYDNGMLERTYIEGVNELFYKNYHLNLVDYIGFYRSGMLKYGCLDQPADIDTGYGKITVNLTINFHPNAELQEVWLTSPHHLQISGQKVLCVGNLTFYDNTQLKSCDVSNTLKINTKYGNLSFNEWVMFYRNGKFFTGHLKKPAVINTPYGSFSFSRLYFFNDGKIRGGELTQPAEMNTSLGKLEVTGFMIYENGNLAMIKIPDELILDRKRYFARIGWDKDGKIVSNVEFDYDTIDFRYW